MSTLPSYLILKVLDNLKRDDFVEGVIIDDIKNKLFRKFAMNFYYIFNDSNISVESNSEKSKIFATKPVVCQGDYLTGDRIYSGVWKDISGKGEGIIYSSYAGKKYMLKCQWDKVLNPYKGNGSLIIKSNFLNRFGVKIANEYFLCKIEKIEDASFIDGFIFSGELISLPSNLSFKGKLHINLSKFIFLIDGEGSIKLHGCTFAGSWKNEIAENGTILDQRNTLVNCKIYGTLIPMDYEGEIMMNYCIFNGKFEYFNSLHMYTEIFKGKIIYANGPELTYEGTLNRNFYLIMEKVLCYIKI